MRRAKCAPLACRKLDEPTQLASPAVEPVGAQSMLLLIPLYCVWLKRLKFSQRKSSAYFSPKAKRLKRRKSKLIRPGLVRVLRRTLPNVRPVGAAYAEGVSSTGPRTPAMSDGTEACGP